MSAPSPSAQLLLVRQADVAWAAVVRPWLESGRGRLQRAHVIVPTRGQAHGFKQRCIEEGIPLLGVEFLTPGLARKKWLALGDRPEAPLPAIGRELLLLGLRTLVTRRLAGLSVDDPGRGLWKSLQSDPERALDDFDDLLKGGFTPADFPLEPLRGIFVELAAWVEGLGYGFSPPQAMAAALQPVPADARRIGGRVLVLGLGAELWGEFFNVAAFVRRCDDLAVVLPAPEFRGRDALDERWVELWEKLLGQSAELIDETDADEGCTPVGALWLRDGGSPDRARLLVGAGRAEEMVIVAATIAGLLARGATNIAVIFPRSDAAHLRLVRLLAARGIAFNDLLETAGPPPVDVQVQRALLGFHERGGRLEDLLALWPWLRALGLVTQPLVAARDVCERCFDDGLTHRLADYQERLRASERAEWKEVARIADLLLPVWPEELTVADALERFNTVNTRLDLEQPAGWPALQAFAAKSAGLHPAPVLLATLASFLPQSSPVTDAPGRGQFARVTLTTRRRSAGLAWSHTIWVESNAGVWPERREPGCWLTDADRETLNAQRRLPLGLFTSEQRAWFEKQGCAALAADTREQIIFTAALHDEEQPELPLAPNAWVERVLWAGGAATRPGGLEAAFVQARVDPGPAGDGEPAPAGWLEVWDGRRRPEQPFDEHFFSAAPALVAEPARGFSARLIEGAIRDPAQLWFESVLGVRRVGWEPLVRSSRKAIGQRVHALLARALRPDSVSPEGFGLLPAPEHTRAVLEALLQAQRARLPDDAYGESFHGEVAAVARDLLAAVHALGHGPWVATEINLPPAARLTLAGSDTPLPVTGRMDLVLSDREGWSGANVRIIDFKTGGDDRLSAKTMAAKGGSLQLGVYLGAVRSLGIEAGSVLMLKPGNADSGELATGELDEALALTARFDAMLKTGVCGALTPDRSAYSNIGYDWPLACVPVPAAVLREKFARTHGEAAGEDGDE
ncbi:MAG: PD-(D/E)XK nuclease family protein [Verrucomicrobiota bacterium]